MQRSIKMLSLILSTFFINDVYSYSLLNTCRGGGEGNTLLRAQYNELDDFFKNQDYCVATLGDGTISCEYVAFGQDTSGNEIWAVSRFPESGPDDNRLYIIPNGTFSEMKAAINNVITLNENIDIYGIACEDKNWYIYFDSHYYKFQIKKIDGKYSDKSIIDLVNIKSNPFPEGKNDKENLDNGNWRWDGEPGHGHLNTIKYPNNITFIRSDIYKTLSYKYNGQEQKQIYNEQNIHGFCYNQKGRVMICDSDAEKLVLITIPELYKK